MSSAPRVRQFLIDNCRHKYSWAAGVSRGTASAIKWHQRDLETAFAEINGLIAGLRYQDQAEDHRAPETSAPSFSPSSRGFSCHTDMPGIPQYPSEITDENLENPPTSTGEMKRQSAATGAAPATEHQPNASHWASIRSLREETAFHHERFQQLCEELKDPTISNLLETYPDAKNIRDVGAQLVKDVLEGIRPEKLELVFAFTSFAYSISQLLFKKGRMEKSEILADINVWRNLISNTKERQAFELIAQRLWPEARDHIHFIPVIAHRYPRNAPIHGFPSPVSGNPVASSFPISPSLPINEQPDLSTAAFSTGHQDPFGSGADCNYTGNLVGLMNLSNEEFHFADFDVLSNNIFQQPLSDIGWTQPNGVHEPPDPSCTSARADGSNDGQEQPPWATLVMGETSLCDTGMFLAVLIFLQDIAGLVYVLSARGFGWRRHRICKAEENSQAAFCTTARAKFFEPRVRSLKFQTPAFSALLSLAEKLTEGGILRSIAEIRFYLVSVATAVLPPGDYFEKFESLVLEDAAFISSSTQSSRTLGKRKYSLEYDSSSSLSESEMAAKANT
ncbi:hypothetical protein C7999DRAFT_34182 [Corynascus novoguineensis]|uniref:Uncharacterized protein n=1 Tax=Corynascus novoguineensis TaxID=1126955 RepID=A0AAN7HMT3_9PEZI|nr:hypothetical protein C7999DRAFT_34182 [Corynascus novoguineensis]